MNDVTLPELTTSQAHKQTRDQRNNLARIAGVCFTTDVVWAGEGGGTVFAYIIASSLPPVHTAVAPAVFYTR